MRTPFNFPRYTYNDYKNWKEDWELIDGYPLQINHFSSIIHSKTKTNLIYQIGSYFNKIKDSKFNLFSSLDWIISESTVVRPDIIITFGEPKSEFLEFPPILIIEVLSPYNLKNDRILKFDLYRENGVKYYLMVDCQNNKVEIYELIDNYYKEVNRSKFQLDKTCEIEFDFDSIWK